MKKLTAFCFLAIIASAMFAAEESARKPWLGMGLVLKNSPDGTKFLYVAAVPEGTPAAKAGFATSDIITHIDKKPIAFRDDLDLLESLAALKPGQVVTFQVTRAGKSRTIAVTTGELPREYEERARESLERARAMREQSRNARSQ